MKPRQTVTKSHALLERIAKRDVISEEQILSDQALLELFSWHTKRAPRARIKDTLAVLVRQGTISQGTIDGQRLYTISLLLGVGGAVAAPLTQPNGAQIPSQMGCAGGLPTGLAAELGSMQLLSVPKTPSPRLPGTDVGFLLPTRYQRLINRLAINFLSS